jgi:hypothetical protein
MDPRLVDYLASIGAPADSLEGWTVCVAQRAGVDVAFVITRGPEIHMLSIAERRAMSRRNIAQFVAPLLDKFGYCTTRVPLSETDHRLREALGFSRTWSDDHFSYWVLMRLPYQKGTPQCQSQ